MLLENLYHITIHNKLCTYLKKNVIGLKNGPQNFCQQILDQPEKSGFSFQKLLKSHIN